MVLIIDTLPQPSGFKLEHCSQNCLKMKCVCAEHLDFFLHMPVDCYIVV